MREGISIEVSAADLERLAAVVVDRNSPQKHVWRARIILATAEGCGTAEIMRRAGVSKPCVWRWQERFMREGVAGLLRDKTRKPGLPPLPAAAVDRVVELTLAEPPGEATHWTGGAMAAASGISLRSVQRIWAAHGLQPHQVRRSKLSHDPAFASKLRDVVGLYLDPPAHSLVLSVDEKSQIQALDRTQPGLPMKKGRAGTMTHDYIRNSLLGEGRGHDHAIRGTQCPRRQRDRPMDGAPSPPGIHPFSEPGRDRSAGGKAHSRGKEAYLFNHNAAAQLQFCEPWKEELVILQHQRPGEGSFFFPGKGVVEMVAGAQRPVQILVVGWRFGKVRVVIGNESRRRTRPRAAAKD